MFPLPTVDALNEISIPVSCTEPWDAMSGDERSRFCGQCRQTVHDVSELTRAEAVQLVSGNGRLPCLRIYRRHDGRVMTADCTTKREKVWMWLQRRSPWVAAVFAFLFFAGCNPYCTAGIPTRSVRPQQFDDAVQSVVGGAAMAAANNTVKNDREPD